MPLNDITLDDDDDEDDDEDDGSYEPSPMVHTR